MPAWMASSGISICSRVCCWRAVPSFPTRRSSDLPGRVLAATGGGGSARDRDRGGTGPLRVGLDRPARGPALLAGPGRSEEHTSELQSHSDLVCRLLPDKKKSIWAD